MMIEGARRFVEDDEAKRIVDDGEGLRYFHDLPIAEGQILDDIGSSV